MRQQELTHTLRRRALRARRDMSEEERATASNTISKRVIASREFYSASRIACYLPMAEEVDTRQIIAAAWHTNKRVFVPVLRGKREMLFCEIHEQTELEQGVFGIWEPTRGFLIPPRQLDLVVTPTVAFDRIGHRIGMGGGYYDRCFAFLRHRKHWIRPKLIGVAFQCQQVEEITPNPWDIRLYRTISDNN